MPIRLPFRSALAAFLLTSIPAFAQQPAAVQIQDPWARATPPHASTAAIYMTLTSPTADKLTGASSPAAAEASVHEMRMQGDVMQMRAVQGGLPLPAGQQVSLAPGGYHVMLEGLKQPLQAGQTIPLHLTFQNAPPADVTVAVQPIGAAGHGPMGGMAMPGMAK